MRGDPGWVVLCRGPGPAPCPQTPWNKCMQNQLGCFLSAWRPRLAFLYAGVQGPLPVLRLLVTRCIFQCSERQSGTGTSARVHTYVYTCLPTSERLPSLVLFSSVYSMFTSNCSYSHIPESRQLSRHSETVRLSKMPFHTQPLQNVICLRLPAVDK